MVLGIATVLLIGASIALGAIGSRYKRIADLLIDAIEATEMSRVKLAVRHRAELRGLTAPIQALVKRRTAQLRNGRGVEVGSTR